jgi:hypothetical protein
VTTSGRSAADSSAQLDRALAEAASQPAPGFDVGRAETRFVKALHSGIAPAAAAALTAAERAAASSPYLNLIDGVLCAPVLWGGAAALAVAAGGAAFVLTSGAPAPALAPPADVTPVSAPPAKASSAPPIAPIEPPSISEPALTPNPPTTSEKTTADRSSEIEHLAQVRGAYAKDPMLALSLARRGHQLYGSGVMFEEREALLILSLAKVSGPSAARERAERFVKRFPQSSFVEAIERAVLAPRHEP